MAKKKEEGINLGDLQEVAEEILCLLLKPQPQKAMWKNQMYRSLRKVHKLTTKALGKK